MLTDCDAMSCAKSTTGPCKFRMVAFDMIAQLLQKILEPVTFGKVYKGTRKYIHQGKEYVFVANSDNLDAIVDMSIQI